MKNSLVRKLNQIQKDVERLFEEEWDGPVVEMTPSKFVESIDSMSRMSLDGLFDDQIFHKCLLDYCLFYINSLKISDPDVS